jgi:hypothetical protein
LPCLLFGSPRLIDAELIVDQDHGHRSLSAAWRSCGRTERAARPLP